MDILTLGKMNQMAKDLDQTMEYLANTTFETLKDVCDVQADINTTQSGQVTCLQDEVALGVDTLIAAGGGGSGAGTTFFVGPHMPDGSTGGKGVAYGGAQCDWIVPAGTKEIIFEIYGGGASGYGGCCCMMNPLPGGAGAYAVKKLYKDSEDFVGDGSDVYSLCGGGTGCCWSGDHGNRGQTSYVTGPGLANYCALGGHPASNGCRHWNCYTCCSTCYGCAAFCGADYGQTGRSSWRKGSQHCASSMFQVAAGAPGPLGQGDYFSVGGCRFSYHNTGIQSPGQGAMGGQVSGSCCCGKAGGAGLVQVTYY